MIGVEAAGTAAAAEPDGTDIASSRVVYYDARVRMRLAPVGASVTAAGRIGATVGVGLVGPAGTAAAAEPDW